MKAWTRKELAELANLLFHGSTELAVFNFAVEVGDGTLKCRLIEGDPSQDGDWPVIGWAIAAAADVGNDVMDAGFATSCIASQNRGGEVYDELIRTIGLLPGAPLLPQPAARATHDASGTTIAAVTISKHPSGDWLTHLHWHPAVGPDIAVSVLKHFNVEAADDSDDDDDEKPGSPSN